MTKLKIILLVFLLWCDFVFALLLIGNRLDFNIYIAKQQSIQKHYVELEFRLQQQERLTEQAIRDIGRLGGYDKCQKN